MKIAVRILIVVILLTIAMVAFGLPLIRNAYAAYTATDTSSMSAAESVAATPTAAPATATVTSTARVVVLPTVTSTVIPTATTAPAVDLGSRLCDAEIVTNLTDQTKVPFIVVPAGYGLVISADPAVITVGGDSNVVRSQYGMLVGIRNLSSAPVKVTVTVGWNPNNGRFNTYPCQFLAAAVLDQAIVKQAAEKKPFFGVYDWDGKNLVVVDLTQTPTSVATVSATATPIVAEPTKAPATEAVAACSDIGADWATLAGAPLTVPVGCEVWISSDPAVITVDGIATTYQTRFTFVVTGEAKPVQISVQISDLTKTHYHLGLIGAVDISERDGAPANQWLRGGKFEDRPEVVR